MKKNILIGFFLLLFCELFADGGNCVKYKVGITLKDSKYIEGFVFVNSYEPKFDFSNLNTKEYIIKNCAKKTEVLTVYLKISQLYFPKFIEHRPDCELHLNATCEENVKSIKVETISEIKLIGYNTCHNCDKFDISDGFYSAGVVPTVVTELTQKEINLLQVEPVGLYSFQYSEEDYYSFKVFSYNNITDSNMLKEISEKFLKSIELFLKSNNWTEINKSYQAFKNDLRTKEIIIFKIGFTP